MKPPPFAFVRAESIDEALAVLGSGGGAVKVLAGGQSLVPLMAFRRARPDVLVDVNEIAALGHLGLDASGDLVVGATCRQHELERLAPPADHWRALSLAVRQMGNYATRMRGTIAGSLAHADPAGELPLVFVLHDGELTARSTRGMRQIGAGDFFIAPHETALAPDELVVEVRFRALPDGTVSGFAELNERVAVASVAIALAARDGRCEWCRIALGGVAPTPMRARKAEAILAGSTLEPDAIAEAAGAAAGACSPRKDTHGSARYRRALVDALVRRVGGELAAELGLR